MAVLEGVLVGSGVGEAGLDLRAAAALDELSLRGAIAILAEDVEILMSFKREVE